MAETIPYTFRMDAHLKREIDTLAAAQYRSSASLLNQIIAAHLASVGVAPISGPAV
jgi:predicted transcriptional regulator